MLKKFFDGVFMCSNFYDYLEFLENEREFYGGDDFEFMNAYINSESLNDFYETVIKLHDEYKNFNHGEFLRRSFIFSGKYLTFAGALMFSNIIRVMAELKYSHGHAEIEALNIWDAYKHILPRLLIKLSTKSSEILRETFINALLNSDYNIDNKINIFITPNPAKILIDNPGILRNHVINKRLEKIFLLSGMIKNKKNNSSSLNIEQNMLNLRVKTSFKIEGLSQLPEPVIL